MLIEQAIFTSAQTARLDGYQVAVHSPGIDPADLRALAVWGPSHDSLLEDDEDAVSVNFHPLPSGAFCISKTTPAGSEYSGRSGPKIYTQFLVTPPEVLARFSNNPFAVLNAAFAHGSLRVYDPLPGRLEPFRLAGKSAAVDRSLLAQLCRYPGFAWLGALVEAAIRNSCLGLVAGTNGMRLISGIVNCLPPECRTELSFSTGLKHSPRRPFRIICLGADPNEQRKLLRQQELAVLEVSDNPPDRGGPTAGWSGFVSRTLADDNVDLLVQEISQARPELRWEDLRRLGDELLEKFANDAAPEKQAEAVGDGESAAVIGGAAEPAEELGAPPPFFAAAASPVEEQIRADAAHLRFLRVVQAGVLEESGCDLELDPARLLGLQCPAAIEQLEQLDDAVFEAIAGKPGAFEQLRALWPQVQSQVGSELLEESREQYIRHALRVWRDCCEGDEIRNPALAVAAMDVVCLLFNA